MPLYTYEHPKTKKQITFLQRMTDTHEYFDGDGVQWNRVFDKPYASVDSQIDPFSYQDFVQKTNGKKGNVGDLWDLSQELSEKRAKHRDGTDPVKQKAIKDYRKKTKGKRHPHE
jgi:hypothetical protein